MSHAAFTTKPVELVGAGIGEGSKYLHTYISPGEEKKKTHTQKKAREEKESCVDWTWVRSYKLGEFSVKEGLVCFRVLLRNTQPLHPFALFTGRLEYQACSCACLSVKFFKIKILGKC